jgi:tRNA-intron endonuclease, archaea type
MIAAELIENKIIVWGIEDSRRLFGSGFFGKPLGIAKPRKNDFYAPIILDLLEGYYLFTKTKQIMVTMEGKKISPTYLSEICRKEYNQFDEKFLVYVRLREAGFVVSSGIKFGADFAAYERGPGIDHAPYLVRVAPGATRISATDIVLAGRLATTVHKQFIIAIPDVASKEVSFLGFDWWRA